MKGIQFENVSKHYAEVGRTFTALDNVTLLVEPGELVAVIGPSGSGKSTLLSIAGALLRPSKGEVIINGTDLFALKQKELSDLRLKQIGFILQTSNLIPYLTVLDQLLLVKKMGGKITNEDKRFAKELLQELGLGRKTKKFPDQLSVGERQRTAIARAFMNEPNIILADEPTASLDTKRAFEIVELITNLTKARNIAAIMVTHDERLLKYCDKVYQMVDGKLSLKEDSQTIPKKGVDVHV